MGDRLETSRAVGRNMFFYLLGMVVSMFDINIFFSLLGIVVSMFGCRSRGSGTILGYTLS